MSRSADNISGGEDSEAKKVAGKKRHREEAASGETPRVAKHCQVLGKKYLQYFMKSKYKHRKTTRSRQNQVEYLQGRVCVIHMQVRDPLTDFFFFYRCRQKLAAARFFFILFFAVYSNCTCLWCRRACYVITLAGSCRAGLCTKDWLKFLA